MAFKSVNPANGKTLEQFGEFDDDTIDALLSSVTQARSQWQERDADQRASVFEDVGAMLKGNVDRHARLMSLEMGKPITQAKSEIEKCAWVCEYYAEHGPAFVADEKYDSDASASYVAYQPLGTVLAIMPWNFPYWQVFRCAAPALVAGNAIVLKHAGNVPQCALAIEKLLVEAGLPENVFRTALVSGKKADEMIGDSRIDAVSLTGSTSAGKDVASCAGRNIKKSVLELGGSDAFVVLPDADLDEAVETGVKARYQNTGQSCIAAKRFIVCDDIADEFVERFAEKAAAQKLGDPLDEATELGPLARGDLRQTLHEQVLESDRQGARIVIGCEPDGGEGYFYPPSVLDEVSGGMPAYEEETFGPVAAMIRVPDEETALQIANDSDFGLGSSVWSNDRERAERYARKIRAGAAFVNGMVKSDPRLPFGGVKKSGYGRELADLGIREFVNAKTVWIA